MMFAEVPPQTTTVSAPEPRRARRAKAASLSRWKVGDVVEAQRADGGEELLDGAGELPGGGGGDDRRDLLVAAQRVEDLQQLRLLHDGREGARAEARAAEDALAEVDLRAAMRVLVDRADGAGRLARDGDLDDGLVGTDLRALAAADALGVVDDGMLLLDRDGLLRAVPFAGAREAAAAVVRDHEGAVAAAVAAGGADGERVAARGRRLTHLLEVAPEHAGLVGLLLSREAEERHDPVLQDRTVVPDGGAAEGAVPWGGTVAAGVGKKNAARPSAVPGGDGGGPWRT